MNKKHLTILLYLYIVVIVASCQSNLIFNEKKTISQPWDNSETVNFELEITDTLAYYKMNLILRNTTDYKYSNLFLFVNTRFPDGHKSRDTLEFVLADINGKWLGKGSGKIKDNNISVRQGLVFPRTGIYNFEFEQAMRTTSLYGIIDIGLQLIKTPEN
ncbi:MAG: gliding motility lipoprotein GldH [Bacteroidetes bacterium]|nr:gliding motility lipoprotein GldH [Bacteroidota bacterium]